jgi:CBS-domain-containing membrane protein
MGLRHLPIVDQRNYVVGIITRKDLLEQVVEAKHAILVSKHQLQSGFRQVMKDLRSRTIQQHQDDLKTTVS